MLWDVQRIYYSEPARIEDNNANGDLFYIRGSVRQGCVLSPRLFSCVLELALGCWLRKVGTAGVDFLDGMCTLLDFKFADDLLLLAKTFQETKFWLDELVTCLAEVGLQLNVRKTKVLTIQSQSPTEMPLRDGQAIEVLDRGSTHKWLGCMLCTAKTGNHGLHLQAACCNARPLQVFLRHGHSCCLFRCCPQKGVQTGFLQDGYCVSPVAAFHCWATW